MGGNGRPPPRRGTPPQTPPGAGGSPRGPFTGWVGPAPPPAVLLIAEENLWPKLKFLIGRRPGENVGPILRGGGGGAPPFPLQSC